MTTDSNVYSSALNRPATTLVIVTIVWKALLLLVAFASPGPGYDTSTTLLLGHDTAASTALVTGSVPWTATLGERLVSKLVRWDAIYFTALAARVYQHEQEWAFSWAFARLMAHVATVLPFANDSLATLAWAGVIISNMSHLLSVLLLHRLAVVVFPGRNGRRAAFLAAALHVFSPAGLFLCAPYGEALFSLLSFSGMLCYAHARMSLSGLRSMSHILLSGICFGLATAIRSNGLLSGLIFLYHVLQALPGLLGSRSGRSAALISITGAMLAGIIVAGGSVIPQWAAYRLYCTREYERPWCSDLPPSVYNWVQKHYWNVGFLRYWTPSNAPLFLLATPILLLMVGSSVRDIRRLLLPLRKTKFNSTEKSSALAQAPDLLVAFALPQLVVAVLAVTNFHVQIVNRICSGYPSWYFAIASGLASGRHPNKTAFASEQTCKSILRLMVIYAAVQGALFASFLPPA